MDKLGLIASRKSLSAKHLKCQVWIMCMTTNHKSSEHENSNHQFQPKHNGDGNDNNTGKIRQWSEGRSPGRIKGNKKIKSPRVFAWGQVLFIQVHPMSLMHCSERDYYIKRLCLRRLIFYLCAKAIHSMFSWTHQSWTIHPSECNWTAEVLESAATSSTFSLPRAHTDSNSVWKIKVVEIWIMHPILVTKSRFMQLTPSHSCPRLEWGGV